VSEPKQGNFESWAIVEIMGHQRHIGHVTTEAYGAAVLFRIDTPGLDAREFTLTAPEYIGHKWTPAGAKVQRPARPAESALVGPATIYRMTPCTEEAARQAIESLDGRPLILLEMPKAPQIAAPDQEDDEDDEMDGEFLRCIHGNDSTCPECKLFAGMDEPDDDPTVGISGGGI
jgi:hypothetical protein